MPQDLDEFLFEHFRARYEFQKERTEKVRDKGAFCINLLTVLWATIIYLVATFPSDQWNTSNWPFLLPLTIACLAAILSSGLIMAVFGWNHKFETIVSCKEMQEYATYIVDTLTPAGLEQESLMEFRKGLMERYQTAADQSALITDKRILKLIQATQATLAGFVVLSFSLPGFLYKKATHEEEPTKVQIVAPEKSPMSTPTPPPTNPQSSTSTPATPAPRPTLKPFPANQLISEGSQRDLNTRVLINAEKKK